MSVVNYPCKICGKEIKSRSVKIFESHLSECHNISFIEYIREYYPEKNGYCLVCGKPTEYYGKFSAGFKKTCSPECTKILRRQTMEETNLLLFGDKNYNNREKFKETYYNKSDAEKNLIREKFNNTCLEKYGTINPNNLECIKEKVRLTKLEKYGSETYNNRDQAKETCLEKYGYENPSQNAEVKNKKIVSCLKHFGVEYSMQSQVVREKSIQTCIKLYGFEHAAMHVQIKEKVRLTKLEKYGSETYNNRDQAKETCLEKYGVGYVTQNPEIKEKIKQTNLERYGASSPLYAPQYLKQQKEHRFHIFIKQLSYTNITLLDTKEEYINNDVHRYSCKEHGEFESEGTRLQTISCPECYKEPRSNLEKQVSDFLSRYVSCETSNRTILNPLELDIYISSHKLAIEFDGLYWHSNVYKEKNYHLEKTEECSKQGIQLIHIFESEWLHKRPIVESILLAKLGIFNKRIYGRKCEVKTLSQELYREFVELNHLQGYVPAKLVLGLYHEDELVEVCSFGKSRFKKNEIELLRHCSKLHYQIIGGFSKLISQWKKLNPEQELFTYCDRRYSNGSSYEKSGWTKVSESAPNYFYIVNGNLESRIKYQKHKLKDILSVYDESLTEQDNMSVNGFSWIYDCGNLKYKI